MRMRVVGKELHRFRIKTLELCYELSEGNSLNNISIQNLAEKLGIKDSHDIKLLGAVQYLADKGFLELHKSGSLNMPVRVTHLGIDEVELNFPRLVI
ncbi:hypothetical protein ES702_02887 [subsurface metagenome]